MMRGAGLAQTDNAWSDIGAEELAARNKAVAKENKTAAAMRTLVRTRARQLADEPPPPDLQRSQDAIRDARTRLLWAEWHRDQAERHRATLDDLIAHHEREAERLLE
jgi:hypothetical protein